MWGEQDGWEGRGVWEERRGVGDSVTCHCQHNIRYIRHAGSIAGERNDSHKRCFIYNAARVTDPWCPPDTAWT